MHRMKVESSFLLRSSFQGIGVLTILQFRQTQIKPGLKRAVNENLYLHDVTAKQKQICAIYQIKWQAVMKM